MPDGLLDKWLVEGNGRATLTHDLMKVFELQAKYLFSHYEPFKGSGLVGPDDFLRRLDSWIGSFDQPDDQWHAFNSLRYFLFVGPDETAELYRAAVQNQLSRWLLDAGGIDIFDANVEKLLEEQIAACWPCPVTDSLRINSLLHVTGMPSKELRPDWYSLRKLGDPQAIRTYAKENGVKYLVLFEDFVGSGGQCARTMKYALETFEGQIFFAPLVICAPGDEKLRDIESGSAGRLSYRPVVVLPADCLVQQTPHVGEPRTFGGLRTAMRNGYAKMEDALEGEEYGWRGVACLYSSFSNCPNNTPPIFHHETDTWAHPIFPRIRRV